MKWPQLLSGCCVTSGSKLTVLMLGLSRHLKGKEVRPVVLVVLFKADCGLPFKNLISSVESC